MSRVMLILLDEEVLVCRTEIKLDVMTASGVGWKFGWV